LRIPLTANRAFHSHLPMVVGDSEAGACEDCKVFKQRIEEINEQKNDVKHSVRVQESKVVRGEYVYSI